MPDEMKKAVIAILFLTSVVQMAWAQRSAQERIEAFKVAFFTQKLQLTTEEARAFWPLYNEYERERELLRQQMKTSTRPELMSDEALRAHLYRQLDTEVRLVELRREYFEKFMEVLPLRKVALILQVERQFKRKLLEELRQRRQGHHPSRSGRRR